MHTQTLVGGPKNGPGTGPDPFANLRTLNLGAAVDPLEIQRMWQEQQLQVSNE